jgi:hypothetical protein
MTDSEGKGERLTPQDPTELERAQAHFLHDLRAGRQPSVEPYLQRLPHDEHELLDFAFYAEAVDASLPDFDEVPATQLSHSARAALDRIARSFAPHDAATPAPGKRSRRSQTGGRSLTSLVGAGHASSVEPAALAQRVGLTVDLLALLDAHAVLPETIPPALVERLAAALGVREDAVASYLRAPAARKVAEAPAPYAAEALPAPARVPFLEAIRASALDEDRKREWAALADGKPHGPHPR